MRTRIHFPHCSVPGAPKDLVLEIVNITATKITWSAPDDPNGVILNYQVTYNGYQSAEPVL